MRGMVNRVDVIVATAVTHNEVTESILELKESGIPTFSVLNDFANGVRYAYVELNNMKLGRIASWMIVATAKSLGKVTAVVGGHR